MKQGILFLLLSSTLLVSCVKTSDTPSHVAPVYVKVLEITETSQVISHLYVGKIQEESRVPLSVQSAGQVLEVCCQSGDRVSKGDVLLRLDSVQSIHRRDVALSGLRQAEDGYQRLSKVYAAKGVTEQQMIEIETKLSQARSLYASAQRSVEDCVLRSPHSGVISDVEVTAGQTIAPGMPILDLVNFDSFSVTFSVPEKEIAAIQIGDTGLLDIPALNKHCCPIRVNEKSMEGHPISHTYQVKAHLQEHAEVLPGMVGTVRLYSQAKTGIVVPTESIQIHPSGSMVWIMTSDSIAERRPITIDSYMSEGVLIRAGLQAGDYVITSGVQKLYNGAKVTLSSLKQ